METCKHTKYKIYTDYLNFTKVENEGYLVNAYGECVNCQAQFTIKGRCQDKNQLSNIKGYSNTIKLYKG